MKLLLENWRKYLRESKLRVFDFDDTLAKSDSKIHITTDTGENLEMTPSEYATHEPREDYLYDFTEFDQDIIVINREGKNETIALGALKSFLDQGYTVADTTNLNNVQTKKVIQFIGVG